MPKQPTITSDAWVPGDQDLVNGNVADWCDLVLDVTRNGNTHRMEVTRNGGEAIIEALHGALHPWAGRSIQEQVWQRLDEVTARLLAGDGSPEDKGEARGLAMALAVFRNPYAPNVDAIRAEAMERQGHALPAAEEDDEDVLRLRAMGILELRRLAETRTDIKNYKRMGKDALVDALSEYDLDDLLAEPDDWDEGF